jgi:hypothetical protein
MKPSTDFVDLLRAFAACEWPQDLADVAALERAKRRGG